VTALQKLHAPAAAVTRDSLWARLYIRRFYSVEAAKLAEREYWSTRLAWKMRSSALRS
jgi:hypothetical protein